MSNTFNELTRVQLPAVIHLMRLGYDYLSLKNQTWDIDTNIFTDIFMKSVQHINPMATQEDLRSLLQDIKLKLDYNDLGKSFFEMLQPSNTFKLIDFENFENNQFNVVTELTYKNGDEEFRPDITLLINGMPLIFIEVKKPNNKGGMLEEVRRMNDIRLSNPKFNRFINLTQFMLFSNNMEYDDNTTMQRGSFYATTSKRKLTLNYFREEDTFNLTELLRPISESDEHFVLKDNNAVVIFNSTEYQTNKQSNRPLNQLCTSLLSKARLAFMLRFGLVYVKENHEWQKHIMRYPQLFATKAIIQHLENGSKSGIIWHTQGSGKTALASFNVRVLQEYFSQKGVVAKFYFIVDRLDLLRQASREFLNRGLVVHTISSKEEFARDIRSNKVVHNDSGKPEITVVNIQKFENDPNVVTAKDYDLSIQRIYFLDEVHRSYKPTGSFLANLQESDRNAIRIGLTGTPLLGSDYNSRKLFGNYIHKYYYNASIADGYTLRLMREDIRGEYKTELRQMLETLEIEKGLLKREDVYAHELFVHPMLDYIVTDLEQSRATVFNDASIGAMVICDSSKQAKMMFKLFNQHYASRLHLASGAKNDEIYALSNTANETGSSYLKEYKAKRQAEYKVNTAALILHDNGTKEERDNWITAFKDGKIDILFVYNMLLTGFDAHRLKKLYFGRVIEAHNLLQALTRVNRPYKDYRFGYVVDFADIRQEFDKTNKDYFDELQNELGDELQSYSHLFKTAQEIETEIEQIKDAIFQYDIGNKELWHIEQINDKKALIELRKVLENAKELYNILRLQQDDVALKALDFDLINELHREVTRQIDALNLNESLEKGDMSGLLNTALEDVIFRFVKVGEDELKLADELKDQLRKTREAFGKNFDPQDPEYIKLKDELERLFKQKKLVEISQEEMKENIGLLKAIHAKILEQNRKDNQLKQRFLGDEKFTRIHKRALQSGLFNTSERKIFEMLQLVKQDADDKVLNNKLILNNESYFERQLQADVLKRFQQQNFGMNPATIRYINQLVAKEYLSEWHKVSA